MASSRRTKWTSFGANEANMPATPQKQMKKSESGFSVSSATHGAEHCEWRKDGKSAEKSMDQCAWRKRRRAVLQVSGGAAHARRDPGCSQPESEQVHGAQVSRTRVTRMAVQLALST